MKYLLKYVILVMIIMFWLLIMFVCSNSAFSKPQIPFKVSVSGRIEVGTDIKSYNTFADIDLGLNIYLWKFKNYSYAGSRTWFIFGQKGSKSGWPYREIYYFGNTLSIKGFFIDVMHFCDHPVSYSTTITKKWWKNNYIESMTTISVGYKFELPIYTNKYFK